MTESWKDVPGYEGKYQVSDIGRVRSIARTRRGKGNCIRQVPARVLLGTVSPVTGYVVVGLYRDAVQRQYGVHQLVLMAFVGPCPEGMEGCHFPDSTRTNNNLSNLRWDTHANNNRDREYAKGEHHHAAKLTPHQIISIRNEYAGGAVQVYLASKYNVTQSQISAIVKRKTWKHI